MEELCFVSKRKRKENLARFESLAVGIFTGYFVFIDFGRFNLLQVKVFFDQLNFQEVQEELSYKVTLTFLLTVYSERLEI